MKTKLKEMPSVKAIIVYSPESKVKEVGCVLRSETRSAG